MSARKKARSKAKRRKTSNKVVRTVRIVNKLGLHARPSAMFVQTANRFPHCRITVSNDSERVNGKSIMGMMTLAAACDSEVTLEIVGDQAKEAADALAQLIASKFDEE
jgi:phosphocarrier protein